MKTELFFFFSPLELPMTLLAQLLMVSALRTHLLVSWIVAGASNCHWQLLA